VSHDISSGMLNKLYIPLFELLSHGVSCISYSVSWRQFWYVE